MFGPRRQPCTSPPSWPPRCRRRYRWLPPDAWPSLPGWPDADGRELRLMPPRDGVTSPERRRPGVAATPALLRAGLGGVHPQPAGRLLGTAALPPTPPALCAAHVPAPPSPRHPDVARRGRPIPSGKGRNLGGESRVGHRAGGARPCFADLLTDAPEPLLANRHQRLRGSVSCGWPPGKPYAHAGSAYSAAAGRRCSASASSPASRRRCLQAALARPERTLQGWRNVQQHRIARRRCARAGDW